MRGVRLHAESLTWHRAFQTGHRTNCSGGGGLQDIVFHAGISPDLVDFSVRFNLAFHRQFAAGHFQPSEPVVLGVMRNAEHAGAEILAIAVITTVVGVIFAMIDGSVVGRVVAVSVIARLRSVRGKRIQQIADALQLQR